MNLKEIEQVWVNQKFNADALIVNTNEFSEIIRHLRGFQPYLERTYDRSHTWEFAGIPIIQTPSIKGFKFIFSQKKYT
jgi:hypothetical protein